MIDGDNWLMVSTCLNKGIAIIRPNECKKVLSALMKLSSIVCTIPKIKIKLCLYFKRHVLISSQGHNLYKLQYISLEEVKIVSFQQ